MQVNTGKGRGGKEAVNGKGKAQGKSKSGAERQVNKVGKYTMAEESKAATMSTQEQARQNELIG